MPGSIHANNLNVGVLDRPTVFGLAIFLLLLTLGLSRPASGFHQEEQSEETSADSAEETKARIQEVIVVTATRREQPLLDSVNLVSVVSASDLIDAAPLVLDQHLRQIPGFSLFRRTGSLAAHPTTQGVSLRGIGPSGTSRTLVLFDGIPLNDPFGGWIYWNRVPLSALQAVEVVRGSTSSLYGSSALGGTIQLIPRRPDPDTIEVKGLVGGRETFDLEFFGSDRVGEWEYLASGRLFDTGGYFLVDRSIRGPVDTPASVGFQTFFGRLYRGDTHVGLNLFRERRDNGTRLQTNRTWISLLEGGLERTKWKTSFYVQREHFRSTFSRILPDRSEEFLTSIQNTPSTGLGGSVTWLPGRAWTLGADWRWVDSDVGSQNLVGVFVQDLVELHPKLDLTLGLRFDVWENQHRQSGFNPRAGLLFRADPTVTLRGSVYRGFRAPTLNELYRPFRVGNVETLANPDLGEEFIWGGEGGLDLHPSERLLLRVNAFRNSLRDPIANVTLSTSPTLILRQRQNLGRVDVDGFEVESLFRWHPAWSIRAAYLVSVAEVAGRGLRVPQVPRHQGSATLLYEGPILARLDGRWVSHQFDDDQNLFRLGGFGLFDSFLKRRLNKSFDLFLAVENILDRRYAVGRTPVESLGASRLVHAGLQFRLGR